MELVVAVFIKCYETNHLSKCIIKRWFDQKPQQNIIIAYLYVYSTSFKLYATFRWNGENGYRSTHKDNKILNEFNAIYTNGTASEVCKMFDYK